MGSTFNAPSTDPAQHVQMCLLQIQEAIARIQARLPIAESQHHAAPQNPTSGAVVRPLTASGHQGQAPPQLPAGAIFQPSGDGINENLLILLHGYGDTPGQWQS